MGTQGMVTVMRDKKVAMKVVAGCSGYNAPKLADALRDRPDATADEVLNMAHACGFGCPDCCVVVTPTGIYPEEMGLDDESLYRTKFHRPKFNPRWKSGLCGWFVRIVWPKKESE